MYIQLTSIIVQIHDQTKVKNPGERSPYQFVPVLSQYLSELSIPSQRYNLH